MLAMAQRPDQGNDIEPELMMRQGKLPFRLWPISPVAAGARRVLASLDLETKPLKNPFSVSTVRRFS